MKWDTILDYMCSVDEPMTSRQICDAVSNCKSYEKKDEIRRVRSAMLRLHKKNLIRICGYSEEPPHAPLWVLCDGDE